jgi:hypothetical protein
MQSFYLWATQTGSKARNVTMPALLPTLNKRIITPEALRFFCIIPLKRPNKYLHPIGKKNIIETRSSGKN